MIETHVAEVERNDPQNDQGHGEYEKALAYHKKVKRWLAEIREGDADRYTK